MSKDDVEIDNVHCIAETDDALLCAIDDDEVWIPKSQLRSGNEIHAEDDEGRLVISHWIAEQKSLA